VTPDITALLALQEQDEVLDAIETRLDALAPREAELAKRIRVAQDAADRAAQAVGTEEQRQAFLREKVAEHKALLEHHQSQLNQVQTMRAATAAASQLEQIRRVLADEESDLVSVGRRLQELRGTADAAQASVQSVEAEQSEAREAIAAERAAIAAERDAANGERVGRTANVSKTVLQKYERIRAKKRRRAVYPLSAGACSACDTAIPVQRRLTMQATGAIELCEGCGVLLYAPAPV
jgi:predicted  nucleic acid-binding Zn-ribbon protein